MGDSPAPAADQGEAMGDSPVSAVHWGGAIHTKESPPAVRVGILRGGVCGWAKVRKVTTSIRHSIKHAHVFLTVA